MDSPASPRFQSALSAATISLAVGAGAAVMFLPPFVDRTTDSTLLSMLLGLAVAVGMLLHFVFVGIAAARSGRRAWLWVLLALITFPIGSIIGLIVAWWFDEDRKAQARAAAHG